jgi:hypothetical protein
MTFPRHSCRLIAIESRLEKLKMKAVLMGDRLDVLYILPTMKPWSSP